MRGSAEPHRRVELRIRPVAYAGLPIRGDVGSEHLAKGRLDRSPAGEGFSAVIGMAGSAISEHRQVAAALDLCEILT